MPNIKQQKKRVGVSSRQRLENLRYKSAIKTLFRRLEDHVDLSETEQAEQVHRELVSLIDRAIKRRALHANTGARKKARAARTLVRPPRPKSEVVRKPKKKHASQQRKKAAPKATAKDDAPKADAKDDAPKATAKAKAEATTDDKPAAKAKAKSAKSKSAKSKSAKAKKPAAKKDDDAKADADASGDDK